MAEIMENHENTEETGEVLETEKAGPGERIKKMKQKLEKLVMAMKQPDEEEMEEGGFEKLFEDRKPEKMPEKADEEASDYVIKDIFADEDGSDEDIFKDEGKQERPAELVEKEKAKQIFQKLPEYNIFDESINDSVVHTDEDVKEIIKKVDTASKPPVKEKKKEMPKITEIYPDKVKNSEEKDFTEGGMFQMVYHSEEKEPFIVIAGKFGRTLRGEYEAVRKFLESEKIKQDKKIVDLPKKPPVTEKKAVPAQKKTANAAVIIKKIEPVIEEVKAEPEVKEVKKENKQKKQNCKLKLSDLAEMIYKEPVSGAQTAKELDDYTAEKDAEDVKTEIEKNLHTMLVRTFVLFVTSVLSVIAAVIMQCTPLFSETMRTGWLFYGIISFALFTIAAAVSRLTIINGIMPLRHFKGNSDTAAAVTSLAAGIQSVTALCTPHVFTNGTYHIYVPIAVIALFCNSLGKLLIITRTLDNFKFLSKQGQKYAGKIYTDTRNAEKMISEFPARSAIIAYMKRSKFMSNFLRLSYAPDPSEKLAAKITPVIAAISVVMGILYGIISMDVAGGVTSCALTACAGMPLMCLVVLNIPMQRLCRSILGHDAMVSGYDAVQQFCDTNAIMTDASQLYPEGTVTIRGMKVFRRAKIDDALQAGAAVMYAVNGTMCYAFESIVHCSRESLPKVDSVVYEDEQGLLAWVNKQRVLIGNRTLLETHNIKVPKKELEEKYTKNGGEIAYISVNGELVVMFMLSYRTDRNIAKSLGELQENGVSFIIRTIDPNVTKEKIAEKFGLFHRCVTVLPTGLGTVCSDVMDSVDESSRAYLVTGGKLTSFARAVSGCIKMKTSFTIARLLQCAGIIFGILVCSMISFVSGFQMLGSLELLIYITFWALFTIIAALRKNR